MSAPKVVRRVAMKELGSLFASPVAWLFLALFAALTLFVFFWVETFFARNVADVRPLFQWMPLLLAFLAPAITMRAWSEERGRGTLEHVLTLPAGIGRFVFGKFLASLALLVLALITTLPLPVTVALIAQLDTGPVIAGYLAALLLGAAYLSIGLFVSACTGNSMVALIASVSLCGGLYLLGSPFLTGFFDDTTGNWLRALGSGSRFGSICRGVVDVRDLYYYLCLCGVFLTLNVYALERSRWSRARSQRHRNWRVVSTLIIINLLLANAWLPLAPGLRFDMTQGRQYTLSDSTRDLIDRLEEPLLLRGYFSARNHPQLAPLIPRLRDLMEEYAIASHGRIEVEIVDPTRHPELEQEAMDRYGLRATPFQVADRHQTTLINTWFQVLISYGDSFETLGFSQLVEVQAAASGQAEVRLRNPEYNLTRAIRDVLYSYRSSGDLFTGIDHPLELVGYASDDQRLPPLLRSYRSAIATQLADIVQESGGLLSVRWVDPAASGTTDELRRELGISPMTSASGSGDQSELYFQLALESDGQLVQLPAGRFDPEQFRDTLRAGLRRFASGFTRTVALAVPAVQPEMVQHHLGAPTFNRLQRSVSDDYNLRLEQLEDGQVGNEADILVVLAPHRLAAAAVYAIDQFLMRGGTVILATSPYSVEITGGQMRLLDWDSGLDDWLAFHGVHIDRALVLDPQASPFPTPVIRQSAGHQFHDVQLLDFPYFIDLRPPGLNSHHPASANLEQVTLGWASPLRVEPREPRQDETLLRSSAQAWQSSSRDISPRLDAGARVHFEPAAERASYVLGAVLQGRFPSYFSSHPLPPALADERASEPLTLLGHSPRSARLVVFASNDFLDDQMLNASIAARGTQYSGAVELFVNTIDWALQDSTLLQIRAHGHFNRSLPAMSLEAQRAIEYFNYALALAWLLLLAGLAWCWRGLRRRHYRRELAL
ncbi:MAG: Gldg family protein [Parahaliea sp.]